MKSSTLDIAERNVREILDHAVEHSSSQAAVVLWDARCDLARGLAQAYLRCLPGATSIEFDSVENDVVLATFEQLMPGDLVVLVESTRFELGKFRFRMELFKRSLKVIEHPHLARMASAEDLLYVESLAYDPDFFRGVGYALKGHIDGAREGWVDGGGERLVFSGGFEAAKLNIGDYRNMQNTGGQYPIGEVVTEAKQLDTLNGTALVFAFGDRSFQVNKPQQPIKLIIEAGRVASTQGSTPEFDSVLDEIRADESCVWVRELGLGLNRAFTEERTVTDMGTYERMCGVHLSIGAKHHIFVKPEIKKKHAKHHVDVMLVCDSVSFDGEEVFRGGAWQVPRAQQRPGE